MIDLNLHHSDLLELGLDELIDAVHNVQRGDPVDLQAVWREYAKELDIATRRWEAVERLVHALLAGTFDSADASMLFANRGEV